MAKPQASERDGLSESNLPERSASGTPKLIARTVAAAGPCGSENRPERIWPAGVWSRKRNRDPTFSGAGSPARSLARAETRRMQSRTGLGMTLAFRAESVDLV